MAGSFIARLDVKENGEPSRGPVPASLKLAGECHLGEKRQRGVSRLAQLSQGSSDGGHCRGGDFGGIGSPWALTEEAWVLQLGKFWLAT